MNFKLDVKLVELKALAALNVCGAAEILEEYNECVENYRSNIAIMKFTLNDWNIKDMNISQINRMTKEVAGLIQEMVSSEYKKYIWNLVPETVLEDFVGISTKLEFIAKYFEDERQSLSKDLYISSIRGILEKTITELNKVLK